jgi:hypothetical protein
VQDMQDSNLGGSLLKDSRVSSILQYIPVFPKVVGSLG